MALIPVLEDMSLCWLAGMDKNDVYVVKKFHSDVSNNCRTALYQKYADLEYEWRKRAEGIEGARRK